MSESIEEIVKEFAERKEEEINALKELNAKNLLTSQDLRKKLSENEIAFKTIFENVSKLKEENETLKAENKVLKDKENNKGGLIKSILDKF